MKIIIAILFLIGAYTAKAQTNGVTSLVAQNGNRVSITNIVFKPAFADTNYAVSITLSNSIRATEFKVRDFSTNSFTVQVYFPTEFIHWRVEHR